MPLYSMTGFARAEGHGESCSWIWEAKSVNAKGLDVRCRLPMGFEGLEPAVRGAAQERFRRGNLTINLSLTWTRANGSYRINQSVLDEVLAILPDLRGKISDADPPSLDGLLGLRGVIEPIEEELPDEVRAALESAILDDLGAALDSLKTMRGDEGARLAEVLDRQVEAIGELCGKAEELAALQPDAIRERLTEQVAELMEQTPALPEERLAQEAALLMTKADVREELDRLKAHRKAAKELLASDGGIGRKLDFLCQEFNREANTLCAKSSDVELTKVGIDLKTVIEQFREQVQNIE